MSSKANSGILNAVSAEDADGLWPWLPVGIMGYIPREKGLVSSEVKSVPFPRWAEQVMSTFWATKLS